MQKPKIPQNVSAFAYACLETLAAKELGSYVSLGGAFGLAHYIEYRTTHDIDAWWNEPVPGKTREELIKAISDALGRFGRVRLRSWGDVTSVELEREGKTVFSFQIADRSARIDEPMISPWPGHIKIDTLDELIASKMNALVERGAPRDFRDIFTICRSRISSPENCWKLWEKRRQLSHENAEKTRAFIAIRSHLSRLEAARPLEGISDPHERDEASRLRSWFEKELLNELPN
jgi:hypothetical protein